jgi:hypothetical protein
MKIISGSIKKILILSSLSGILTLQAIFSFVDVLSFQKKFNRVLGKESSLNLLKNSLSNEEQFRWALQRLSLDAGYRASESEVIYIQGKDSSVLIGVLKPVSLWFAFFFSPYWLVSHRLLFSQGEGSSSLIIKIR